MIGYVAIFVLGALTVLMLRRLLLALVRWGMVVLVVLVAGRLALMADDRLSRPSWLIGATIGGVAAFVVVGILSYALIYHSLVAADERRDVERAHETAKRRRLW